MFDEVYGFSCVENQVLAQLKLKNMDISKLYLHSFISIDKLLLHYLESNEAPEYFSLIPRIHDELKNLNMVNLTLIKDQNLSSLLCHVNTLNKTVLIKVKQDYVKSVFLARGLRDDHYSLLLKESDRYFIINDIPYIKVEVDLNELQKAYDGCYFLFEILKSISYIEDSEVYNDDFAFFSNSIKEENAINFDIEKINSLKIRNFFWIYKIIIYRQTEFFYRRMLDYDYKKERTAIDNLFCKSEYFHLKKCNDINTYYTIINEARNINKQVMFCAQKWRKI